MTRLGALLTVVLLLFGPLSTVARADPQDVANDVSNQVMSPYCPGVTLHDCASGQASKMREQIVKWAEAGWSKERIMDRLEAEFGATIRATPPAEGAGILAWLLPALAVAFGALVGIVLVRRWNLRAAPASPATSAEVVSPEDRRRVSLELKRLRRET